ncbi:hypothetical protein ACHAWF_006708 [Thalassiosira exigua]
MRERCANDGASSDLLRSDVPPAREVAKQLVCHTIRKMSRPWLHPSLPPENPNLSPVLSVRHCLWDPIIRKAETVGFEGGLWARTRCSRTRQIRTLLGGGHRRAGRVRTWESVGIPGIVRRLGGFRKNPRFWDAHTTTVISAVGIIGSVHRRDPNREYAVKCVQRSKLKEEDVAALKDEVSILSALRGCAHIIRLYDFFDEPDHFYLVMETMHGGELFDRIVQKSYYNEKEARMTCKILLEAVDYCHERRVAHRDLKPENLLLRSETDDSSIKIADFGFAKVVKKPQSLKTQCGTPPAPFPFPQGYVSPEILTGTPYDESADMWSVGVILYILLGGYPPFIDDNQRKLFRKIRKGQYEFHEEYWGPVSEDAKALITGLLCVNASERLTAREALRSNWIALASDESLEQNDMGSNLMQLRKFNGKRKFRAAVMSVIAANKLRNFLAFDTFQPGCHVDW